MTTSPAPPPPLPRRPPRHRRRASGPEARSIQIGVIGTVLVHLLLLWLAPRMKFPEPSSSTTSTPAPDAVTFDVQLASDAFAPKPTPVLTPKPAPPRFVEINPAAPDNVPDKTNNVGAQNQQVAQPTPTPNGKSDTPAVKGDPAKPSTAIVTGQEVEPLPLPPVPVTPPPTPATEQPPARRAQNPLPGFETTKGTAPDAIGSTVAPAAPNATAPARVEGNPAATPDNGFTIGLAIKVDPEHPQPRPSLVTTKVQARPTPLLNNLDGTTKPGPLAYDAKWSSYGEYIQRLINSISAQWHRIVEQSALYPERGTKVAVKFRLNSRGEVDEIVSVISNGNSDAQTACVSAIVARAPYGVWTDDMVTLLGQTQELTFNFYYE